MKYTGSTQVKSIRRLYAHFLIHLQRVILNIHAKKLLLKRLRLESKIMNVSFINKSEGVASAAYFATSSTNNYQAHKLLLTMMRRAQRPVQLVAGGIINMSVQTFGSVSNCSNGVPYLLQAPSSNNKTARVVTFPAALY